MIRSPTGRGRTQRSSSAESHETVQPDDSDDSTDVRVHHHRTMPNSNASTSSNGNASLSRLRIDPPLLDLEVDRGPAFRSWMVKWRGFFRLTRLDQEDNEHQVLVLQHCLSRSSITILSNLGISDDPTQTTVNDIIAALKGYADQQLNSTMAWHNLHSRQQDETESVEDFVIALRELVKDCDTCSAATCAERAVCVQFVRGLRNAAITQELLKVPKLVLRDAITTAKAFEQASSGSEKLHTSSQTASINKISTYKSQQKSSAATSTSRSGSSSTSRSNDSSDVPPCNYCGRRERHSKQECPAAGQVCAGCNKVGHFKRVCRSSRGATKSPTIAQLQLQIQQLQQQHYQQQQTTNTPHTSNDIASEADIEPPFNVFALHAVHAADHAAPRVHVNCSLADGKRYSVTVLPDTGADISAVGVDFPPLKEASITTHPSAATAGAANGARMQSRGSFELQWHHDGRSVADVVNVFDGVTVPLISWKVAVQLGIITYNAPRVNAIKKTAVKPEPTVPSALVEATRARLLDEFSDVFSEDIKIMQGESFKINLSDDAVPYAVPAPRVVPFALRDALRDELNNLESKGIIEKVSEPTQWCSPIVLEMRNGKLRICVDFTKLNQFVQREFYYSDPPHIQVADICSSQATYFTKLDAVKGYHQCPLHESSRHLTTFITPFGRYQYLRAPFGVSSISDYYNRRMDECLSMDPLVLSLTKRTTDDMLLHHREFEQHVAHVRRLLIMARKAGITLSKEKFEFGKQRIKFAGYVLTPHGYTIDPAITTAISSFPVPKNVTDLRSFFGLANQLTGSRADLAAQLAPLRPLLSTKNSFVWTPQHDEAFQNARTTLTSPPTMAYFDLERNTRILTDASRVGLGFVVQQEQPDKSWKPIQAGSRALSAAERNYAVIELELLAVAFAVKKAHIFIAHRTFVVMTDHKPIVPIINNKRMDDINNPRLLRLRLFLSGYQLSAVYIPGTHNKAADALSRAPVERSYDTSISAITLTTPPTLAQLIHQHSDDDYRNLMALVIAGFPQHRNRCPPYATQFWQVRSDLSVENNVVFCGSVPVIPSQLRRQLLDRLHLAHQGVTRTQALARTLYFWPQMSNDVYNLVQRCRRCQDNLQLNAHQPLVQQRASYPFQVMAADFFQVGKTFFLVIVDYFSNWPELIEFRDTPTAKSTIQAFSVIFARFGYPQVLRTDNGPQFAAQEFRTFLRSCAIELQTSAPRYPQSNGKAEAAVKVLKALVHKVWNPTHDGRLCLQTALQCLRNFPSANDSTPPAMKVFGRPITSAVPRYTTPCVSANEQTLLKQEQRRHRQKLYFDSRTRTLPQIPQHAHVAVYNTRTKQHDIYGTVIGCDPGHRRYTIKCSNGSTIQRDRYHLKKRHPYSLPAAGIVQSYSRTPGTCEQPSNTANDALTYHDRSDSGQVIERGQPPQPRRSTRQRRAPDRLIVSM